MSHTALEFDLDAVWPVFAAHSPNVARSEGMVAIGLRHKGELVAGVVYEGYNGHNVWMHIATVPGNRAWRIRKYLRACFFYAFITAGVQRVSGYVEARNVAAIPFIEHIGFRREATLKGAASDGGDVIIYAMRKKDYRYGS